MPLLLVRLTDKDFDRFHRTKIPYSGSTGRGAIKGYEPYGPYIATFSDYLLDTLKALKWKRTVLKFASNQIIVYRLF